MLSTTTPLVSAMWIALAVLAYMYITWQKRVERERIAIWRQEIEAAYQSTRTVSTDQKGIFDPANVTIVEDKEQVHRSDGVLLGLGLTRYVRNPAGEYFMFMHSTDRAKPYIKHVPHNVARAVLKEKYVAPGA